MMTPVQSTPNLKTNTLDAWLDAVTTHLAVRREESRSLRPNRDRERQKARREARRLFAEYYRRIAIASGQLAA